MGLLDDAIREHLELKRRHGADPDEVARQEREALGAAQRAEFAATPEEEAGGDGAAAPFDAEAAAAAPAEPAEPEPAPEAPPAEPEPPPPGREEDPWSEPDPDEVPAEESLDRAPREQAEDVLEETPEFLQETPEHDRLWFEQRPPRDFDWDK